MFLYSQLILMLYSNWIALSLANSVCHVTKKFFKNSAREAPNSGPMNFEVELEEFPWRRLNCLEEFNVSSASK